MDERTTLIVTEADIGTIFAEVGIDQLMDETIATLERAFAEYGDGATTIRARTGFVYDVPEPGLVEFMPAMRGRKRVVMKVVGYHPGNPVNRGLPTILATNSLYDVTNGHLIALVDGTFATAVRTGAASAVASTILAKPDSRTLGIIGTGAQAVTQLHALSRRFAFDRVFVHDIEDAHQASFVSRAGFVGLPIEIVDKAEVLARADILVVATSNAVGAKPVVVRGPHQTHLHINAVGSDIPGKVELAREFLSDAGVFPDYREQALVEGECQQLSPDMVGLELHELIKHPAKGIAYRNGLTVFDSTGNPLEDLAITEILVGHAKRLGLGQDLVVEAGVYDALDPYRFAPPEPVNARLVG